MMRSPSFITLAVRKKSGHIKTKKDPFNSLTARYKLLKLPLIRGIVNLFEMIIVGMNAINFSAQEYADDYEEAPGAKIKTETKKEAKTNRLFEIMTFTFSIVLSLALAIFLFKFIPLGITELLRKNFPFIAKNYIVFNLVDGALRIGIFLLYVFSLSLFKTFRRIFEYHGAEHMAVFTYEKRLPLTVENARTQSRLHPRCGTSFLLAVFVISIIIYTFVPRNPVFWLNLAQRIAVLPLIAAIGYELLKWSAKHTDKLIVKMIVSPGLATQRITTKPPDDTQLEVALKALELAVQAEGEIKVP